MLYINVLYVIKKLFGKFELEKYEKIIKPHPGLLIIIHKVPIVGFYMKN